MQINAFIGYDYRMPLAYAVTVRSLMEKAKKPFPVNALLLTDLIAKRAYDRAMYRKDGQMFDVISDAPMATEFAISRFFVPWLNRYEGWSLFCDNDFLFRSDIWELFEQMDDKYAVMCVKHEHCPTEAKKMDGQLQTLYKRKNWSSLMLINNAHPKNKVLEPKLLNALPGRDLHAFTWLDNEDIGALDPEWNWLEGHSSDTIDPCAVHYTRGTPDLMEYMNAPFSEEWRAVANTISLCEEIQ